MRIDVVSRGVGLSRAGAIATVLLAACSGSDAVAPRPAPVFSTRSISTTEAQTLPVAAATGGTGSVTVTGVVVAPDPPCSTSISASDGLSGNTLTVHVVTTVPGPGAAACAQALDGPDYAFTETSVDVPAGSVHVLVKYDVAIGGNTSTLQSSTTSLDQIVTVQ